MNTKHTPGPLVVLQPYTDRTVWPIGKPREGRYPAFDIIGEASLEADARLWSRAPSLLAENARLREVLTLCKDWLTKHAPLAGTERGGPGRLPEPLVALAINALAESEAKP